MRRTRFMLVLALVTIASVVAAAQFASAAVSTDSTRLREAVTIEGILEHEWAFQAIADANGDTRASATPGYDASATYVAGRLQAVGYDVTVQPFAFELFTENSPSELEQTGPDPTLYANGDDFITMEYSGSGEAAAPVQTVDTAIQPTDTSTSGCEPEDFAGFTAGNIALMQRGTCTFAQKAENAENAGASAALIFNRGTEGNTEAVNGTLGGDSDVGIPALGLSFAVGADLADPAGTTARVFTDTRVEQKQTSNVIAETKTGRSDRVAFAGAHLDSVAEGPGINDNGSGSATILEVAEAMSALGIQPRNKVRFAFWGAEESGLLGAEYYVSQLSKSQQKDIAVYLNFDMVGSPNYGRFIYDGDGSATPAAGPNGSATAERVFEEYFASQGLSTLPTAFDGRSDYGPFIAAGIPAGGLFTGAEDVKTEQEAALFGGLAGAAFDPCYHSPCDSFTPVEDGADAETYAALEAAYDLEGNVNWQALDEMSDATAHAVLTFARTTSAVNGTEKGSGTPPTADFEYKGSHARR